MDWSTVCLSSLPLFQMVQRNALPQLAEGFVKSGRALSIRIKSCYKAVCLLIWAHYHSLAFISVSGIENIHGKQVERKIHNIPLEQKSDSLDYSCQIS